MTDIPNPHLIKKLGVQREILYISSERALAAIPLADLRSVTVAGNTVSVVHTGALTLVYEGRDAKLVYLSYPTRTVQEAVQLKADVDALLVDWLNTPL